jgi:hypothetical protein
MELHEQSLPEPTPDTEKALTEDSNATIDVNTPIKPSESVSQPEATVDATNEPLTKDRIVALAEDLSKKEANEISRDDVSRLKQQFYAIRHDELETEKAAFLAKGNEESAFAPMPDAAEERLKEIISIIKDKKAQYAAEQEAIRLKNYETKNAIIDELTDMADDTDNVNRHFTHFRELQQAFKTAGEVAPTNATEQWKRYQEAVERFYDQLKVNKDLRDYDFRKNLDVKQLLCAEAEKLNEEPDVITAFKRLQELHEKWRETGPVAKEIREEIWLRFKDASANINKKYQSFFEERKQREGENEAAKTALCERLEALNFDTLKNFAAWDAMTRTILDAQKEWKELGFVSRKTNAALYARFRATCDKFFAQKAEFFKNTKDELSQNLAKKTALCERAEALQTSTDWKKTTEELIALQQEWKTIGAVAKKHSDAIWRRFLNAYDYFFEQKKKNASDTRRTEQANLKEKRDIIEEIKGINADVDDRATAIAKVKELTAKYQTIGHVPYRNKDKVYEAYRAAVNDAYARLGVKESRSNMANFESSIAEIEGDEQKLLRERERLMRALELKRGEISTFENNLGFFNSKSKSGDSMLREMERRIQHLKEDLTTIEEKIRLIDEKLA